MFFLASKILYFVFMPFTWIIVMLLWSWKTKNPVRRKKLFVGAIITLLVFSNRFVLNQTMMAWEVQPIAEPSRNSYDAIIVMGGFSTYNERFDRINFTAGADRMMQGIQLLKNGVAPVMVITSGSGSITFADHKEAKRTGDYLRKIGIPDSMFILENESRNTHENAVNTAAILKRKFPNGNFLVVTSGFHMRRTVACFAHEGIHVIPYSVDMQGGPGRYSLDYFVVPEAAILTDWNMLIHEWIGCLTYTTAGYM